MFAAYERPYLGSLATIADNIRARLNASCKGGAERARYVRCGIGDTGATRRIGAIIVIEFLKFVLQRGYVTLSLTVARLSLYLEVGDDTNDCQNPYNDNNNGEFY